MLDDQFKASFLPLSLFFSLIVEMQKEDKDVIVDAASDS